MAAAESIYIRDETVKLVRAIKQERAAGNTEEHLKSTDGRRATRSEEGARPDVFFNGSFLASGFPLSCFTKRIQILNATLKTSQNRKPLIAGMGAGHSSLQQRTVGFGEVRRRLRL
jgi:hypothetical protein